MSDDGNQRPIPTGLTFHITPKEVWEAQKASGSYQPEAFVDEGFVHATNDLETLLIPANEYYSADDRPYVCLTIALSRVTGEVRFDAYPLIYPPIYAPVPVDSITEVRNAERDSSGAFTGFGPPCDS